MVQPELLNYVQQNLSAGYAEEQIRQQLLQSGYSEQDADAAFAEVSKGSAENSAKDQEQPKEQDDEKKGPPMTIIIAAAFLIVIAGGFFILHDIIIPSDQDDDPGRMVRERDDAGVQPEEQTTDIPAQLEENRTGASQQQPQQQVQIPDNCRIYANELTLSMSVGESKGLFASGYSSAPEDVRWTIDDVSVGTIIPLEGSFTTVTAISPGTTNIAAIDSAIGDMCRYKIELTVE